MSLVLVVDDQESIRSMLARVLEDQGIDPACASTPDETHSDSGTVGVVPINRAGFAEICHVSYQGCRS